MSTMYDIDNWFVTANRALKAYIEANIDDVTVEMNFPDTTKLLPLEQTLVHLEVDDIDNPVVGFGTPGVEVFDEVNGTAHIEEVQVHVINFDIGVWVSKESGGATHRMEVVQALINLFARPEARKTMRDETGMWVVSFAGGRSELDDINGIPVWRSIDMTLVLRVVSRHIPATPEIVATDIDQTQGLTITNDTGDQSPVE